MTTLVSVLNVSHRYGAQKVLDNVSMTIGPGSYTVLLGPSGSGKTTLLSVLGGFLRPDEGRVEINGVDCTGLPPARRPTTTVFQDYALFPHMTIGSNVGFGLRMQGMERQERERKARAMLAVVGLDQAFGKKPHQLSGGQRQRVALARALAVEPAVLLLDEPLGALDLKLRRQMQDELKAIQKRVGTAFVHVTHDQEEAMALADHVVVMNHGRIEDEGTPERVYARPATRFSATFMGESTIIPGLGVAENRIETPLGTFDIQGGRKGMAAHLAIRPEHISLDGSVGAKVGDVIYQGSFKRVTFTVESQPSLAVTGRLAADTAISEGDVVKIGVEPSRLILLRD
jgi:spermidine/putrescine transport system ATP-binding protein